MFPKSAILKLGSLNSRVQGVVEPAASFVAHVDGRARTNYVGPETRECGTVHEMRLQGRCAVIQDVPRSTHMRNSLAESSVHLQLRVLLLGLLQDGDVGVGSFIVDSGLAVPRTCSGTVSLPIAIR